MKIGLVVNRTKTEVAGYSTTRIGMAATNREHDVAFIGVGDFTYATDGSLHASALVAPAGKYKTVDDYFAALRGEQVQEEEVILSEFDVLLLRNDPAEDLTDRPWAQTSGILFAELATRRGVIVLNDPANLSRAINKTYFQHFPEQVRPRTCISRDPEEIKKFIRCEKGRAVLKPLQGSGGQSVFLVQSANDVNTNQMIEAIVRDGYAIAQEYLPGAAKGDIRLFVMNGQPLSCDGEYAAFRRVGKGGDMRSNMHAGARVAKAVIDEAALGLVEMIRPQLVRDGMWMVGLDIIQDKLVEINVFSPGGLGSAQELNGQDFATEVVRDLERKVAYRRHYGTEIDNLKIAILPRIKLGFYGKTGN